ncbi:MAG: hypothetical protein ACREM1_18635 [Longimicrobiales bacterium]
MTTRVSKRFTTCLTLTCLAALIALAALAPVPSDAQLRPVYPLDLSLFDSDATVLAGVGAGLLTDQHASLAGTRGTLYELGNFDVAWRGGRVVLGLSGTVRRVFDDDEVVREPWAGTQAPSGRLRYDAGDIHVSTTVALTNPAAPGLVALRFGSRLPTPSDERGLDRDRTDFYATIGGRQRWGRIALTGESGVSINGTRDENWDQLDVWMYSLGIELDAGHIIPSITIVGQDDLHSREIRGNENLSEVRAGVRTSGRYWIQASAVKGIARFSPGLGLLISAGIRR